MKSYIAILSSLLVLMGLATTSLALQNRGSGARPSVSRPSGGGRSAPSTSSSTSSGSVSSSSSSSGSYRPAGISRPSRDGFSGGSGGGAPSVPEQTYTPNSRFNYSHWYNTNLFFDQLLLRYGYLRGWDYLWRYAQNDSPLTQEVVNLALSESSLAADSLVATAEEIESLIDAYESGSLGQESFEVEVERATKRIRELAKQIRKDDLLEYLDQSPKAKVPAYDRARSIAELRLLCQELHRAARDVANGIDAYYQKDMTRVIDVNDLQRPSFGTMTKEIDRLAKTISKSADRL